MDRFRSHEGKPQPGRTVPGEARRPIAKAFGALRGKVALADDFDELPAELAEHFRGPSRRGQTR